MSRPELLPSLGLDETPKCKRGHLLTPDNVNEANHRGYIEHRCKKCRRIIQARYRIRKVNQFKTVNPPAEAFTPDQLPKRDSRVECGFWTSIVRWVELMKPGHGVRVNMTGLPFKFGTHNALSTARRLGVKLSVHMDVPWMYIERLPGNVKVQRPGKGKEQ